MSCRWPTVGDGYYGAGEVAQDLRALTALPEGLGSLLSTHRAAHNHLSLRFSLPASQVPSMPMTHICKQNIHAHNFLKSRKWLLFLKVWKQKVLGKMWGWEHLHGGGNLK